MEKKISVLVVDDDGMNRELITRGLEKEGYNVANAESGRIAMQLIEVEHFDLFLLDIMMPEVDGVELLRHIRKHADYADIPVIMMSANNDRENVRNCIEIGANDFIVKPLSLSIVKERIARLFPQQNAWTKATVSPYVQTNAVILAVDDEELNRELLNRRLKKLGYAVATASGGGEAIKLLKQRSFDLVLLDLNMPEMSGIDVLRAMRDDDEMREIPVIMLTAQSDKDSVKTCAGLGAAAYLLKPFDSNILKQRIQECLH